MKWLLAAVVAAGVLTGCTSAGDIANNEEAFSVTTVDGTKCIIFKPYESSGDGTQMDCNFWKEGDE